MYGSQFEVNYTEASECAFVEKEFMKHFLEEFHFGVLSYQAKAQAYNQATMDTYKEKRLKEFIRQNPEVGRRFLKKDTETVEKDDGVDNDEEEGGVEANETTLMHELTRKTLSQAMLNYEVKQEMLEEGTVGEVLFGPKKEGGKHVNFKDSRRIFFETTDAKRKERLYPHRCFEGCKKRGCEDISTFDGLWKIHHPLCMWDCPGYS